MKINKINCAGITVAIGALLLAGCEKGTTAADVGEKTGAALDTAAEKTVEATQKAGTATKEFTGKALDKTGEALEKAGTAVENTGEKMQ